jgi:hypothetical protein
MCACFSPRLEGVFAISSRKFEFRLLRKRKPNVVLTLGDLSDVERPSNLIISALEITFDAVGEGEVDLEIDRSTEIKLFGKLHRILRPRDGLLEVRHCLDRIAFRELFVTR